MREQAMKNKKSTKEETYTKRTLTKSQKLEVFSVKLTYTILFIYIYEKLNSDHHDDDKF